ncbi:hypothetical protein D9V34_03980 [Mycetocola lacteus]|uniref:Uncharacterized protein n=1 Tax=Mycetocola lacteus TaxID=76637 RepID=A0A3L7AWP6_9MICO|nr:hypothetical protein D9V34_03980 [Mycetocola lacteus]
MSHTDRLIISVLVPRILRKLQENSLDSICIQRAVNSNLAFANSVHDTFKKLNFTTIFFFQLRKLLIV